MGSNNKSVHYFIFMAFGAFIGLYLIDDLPPPPPPPPMKFSPTDCPVFLISYDFPLLIQ